MAKIENLVKEGERIHRKRRAKLIEERASKPMTDKMFAWQIISATCEVCCKKCEEPSPQFHYRAFRLGREMAFLRQVADALAARGEKARRNAHALELAHYDHRKGTFQPHLLTIRDFINHMTAEYIIPVGCSGDSLIFEICTLVENFGGYDQSGEGGSNDT